MCVTTAIVYFYLAAWSAARGEPYWLPMLCCAGFLIATTQDRMKLPGLQPALLVLGVAPIALHISVPQQGWFPIYMIGIAAIVFAPASWVHAVGRFVTRPARNVRDEEGSRGLDERASQVFYASLVGLVAAPMVSMFVDLPGVKTGCTLTAIAMLFVMGRQLYLTPRFRPVWRVASLFGASLALWLTVSVSDARFDYYRNAAVEADRSGDEDAAAFYRGKAERYAR